MLFLLILIVLIVFADQLTKWLAVVYLKTSEGIDVIPGLLRFEYTENRGMAFGMLDGHRWVFMVVSTVMIVMILIYLWRKPPKSRLVTLALAFIVGGGIGNMIDRTLLGYVIDFIYPCMIPSLWPWIFNVADSFVTVGTGILIGYLLFDLIREWRAEKKSCSASETEAEKGEGDGQSDA